MPCKGGAAHLPACGAAHLPACGALLLIQPSSPRSTHCPASMQYAPWLGMLVLKRVGPARARALRDGKSGYDVAGLLAAKQDAA